MNRQLKLQQLLAGNLKRFGGRDAVVSREGTWSYEETAHLVEAVARSMTNNGVAPGSPVALLMSNRFEFLVCDLAIIRIGATKVPISTMLSAAEIDFILNDSGASLVIADASFVEQACKPEGVLRVVVVGLESGGVDTSGSALPKLQTWDQFLAPGDPGTAPSESDSSNLGAIFYTGGTTGAQKGVAHTQGALAINLMTHVIEMNLGDDERILITTPLAHSAGLVAQAGLVKGATLYLENKFEPVAVIDHISQNRITFMFMVPTMIYRLLDLLDTEEAAARADLSSLRTVLYGAAPIRPARLAQGIERLGPVFMQLYGQTEAPNFVTRLRKADHDLNRPDLLGSCGQAVPLMEVCVHDDAGCPVPAGVPGEIVVRGPYVMDRYHNLPEKTDEVLKGGWLHSGDLGYLDVNGYLYLLDRRNDMIITGGLNVYPSEVENALQSCEGVEQVAVVGVTDSDWGERVVAFVVPSVSEEFSKESLLTHCVGRLARYKHPKDVYVIESMPLTAYGKVDRRALASLLAGSGDG